MSGFYIQPSASASTTSAFSDQNQPTTRSLDVSDDDFDLPFPTPLPRAAFLAPDFTPAALLSTLTPRTRHQTLEDLRSELRGRSGLLSRELLDLVNSHYTDFIALGSALKGGDEKVDEVRVSLLALCREIERVRERVTERQQEVATLVAQREKGRRELEKGRELLRWLERVELLEGRLRIRSAVDDPTGGKNQSTKRAPEQGDGAYELVDSEEDSEIDEDEDEEVESVGDTTMSTSKLARRVDEYREITRQAKRIGSQHPLVQTEWPRVQRLKETILLDLSTSLRESYSSNDGRQTGVLKILSLFKSLGAEQNALDTLKR